MEKIIRIDTSIEIFTKTFFPIIESIVSHEFYAKKASSYMLNFDVESGLAWRRLKSDPAHAFAGSVGLRFMGFYYYTPDRLIPPTKYNSKAYRNPGDPLCLGNYAHSPFSNPRPSEKNYVVVPNALEVEILWHEQPKQMNVIVRCEMVAPERDHVVRLLVYMADKWEHVRDQLLEEPYSILELRPYVPDKTWEEWGEKCPWFQQLIAKANNDSAPQPLPQADVSMVEEDLPSGRGEKIPDWVPKNAKARSGWKEAYRIIKDTDEEYLEEYREGDAEKAKPTLIEYSRAIAKKMSWNPCERTIRKIKEAGDKGWI